MTKNPEMLVNVAQFLPSTEAEGPGKRTAIWVQGCSIHCPSCCNPEMLPFVDRQWTTVETLVNRILAVNDIEGVTFLGGEPFQQAAALAHVAEAVRQSGLSVMTFSGYTLSEIQQKSDSGWQHLLSETDLLVAGPFVRELYTEHIPWIGSSNQTLHIMNERYAYLANELPHVPAQNRTEIRIRPENGTILINGFAYKGMIPVLRDWLRHQGIILKSQANEGETKS